MMLPKMWNLNFVRCSLLLLFVVVILVGCKSGTFWSERVYFPAKSLPEEAWKAVVIIQFRVQPGDRLDDVSEKLYSIHIKDKKGNSLYSESGKMKAGMIHGNVQWPTLESLNLQLKSEAGDVLLERDLKYDSPNREYRLK